MSTQGYEYQKVRMMLMPQMKKCRDKDLRVKVELLLYGLRIGNVRLACKRLGFGKSSYYKWWNRLVAGRFKIAALKDRSRRPRRSPGRIPLKVEKRIQYFKRRGFGAEMIRHYLIREGLGCFAVSTIHHVICQRRPPKKVKRLKLKKHRRRYELPMPGQRLQIDVKYSPMQVGGKTVYIFVAIDECTRWRYARAYPELNWHWTEDFMSEIKSGFPFPIKSVQTDNGHEFTFKLLGGNDAKHPLSQWCVKNRVEHRLIPPGVKELNGKVERSHRIDAEYFYGRAPTSNLKAFNAALKAWIKKYNLERPHGGISFMTPVEKLRERIFELNKGPVEGLDEAQREVFIKSVTLIGGPKIEGTAAA